MERKSFNTKAKVTNKRSNAVGQKLQTESALLEAEKKRIKTMVCLGSTVHLLVAMENTTNSW